MLVVVVLPLTTLVTRAVTVLPDLLKTKVTVPEGFLESLVVVPVQVPARQLAVVLAEGVAVGVGVGVGVAVLVAVAVGVAVTVGSSVGSGVGVETGTSGLEGWPHMVGVGAAVAKTTGVPIKGFFTILPSG